MVGLRTDNATQPEAGGREGERTAGVSRSSVVRGNSREKRKKVQ